MPRSLIGAGADAGREGGDEEDEEGGSARAKREVVNGREHDADAGAQHAAATARTQGVSGSREGRWVRRGDERASASSPGCGRAARAKARRADAAAAGVRPAGMVKRGPGCEGERRRRRPWARANETRARGWLARNRFWRGSCGCACLLKASNELSSHQERPGALRGSPPPLLVPLFSGSSLPSSHEGERACIFTLQRSHGLSKVQGISTRRLWGMCTCDEAERRANGHAKRAKGVRNDAYAMRDCECGVC